jgi:hypothetical protein
MSSVQSINVWTAKSVSAGASLLSHSFNLGQWADIDYDFGLHVAVTGSGTAQLQYAVSGDNSNFYVGGTDIVTAHTLLTGMKVYNFTPELAQWLKIKVIETTTTDAIAITAYLQVR